MTEQTSTALREDCVEWERYRDRKGYGRVRHEGNVRYAHRVAYVQHHGLHIDDIAGQAVRHRCDNPACVNPVHLELGAHADNMRDMAERGRAAKGEAHGSAKITEADVLDILAEYVRGSREHGTYALARKYGVSQPLISQIVNREIWMHVSDDQAPAQ